MNIKGVNMGIQRSTRGVWVLPLVEVSIVLGDFSHISPGRVGRPGGCVEIPSF